MRHSRLVQQIFIYCIICASIEIDYVSYHGRVLLIPLFSTTCQSILAFLHDYSLASSSGDHISKRTTLPCRQKLDCSAQLSVAENRCAEDLKKIKRDTGANEWTGVKKIMRHIVTSVRVH